MVQNVLRLLKIVRAQWAVSRIRRQARVAGLDQLTQEDIDSEIRLARAERRRKRRFIKPVRLPPARGLRLR